jgi:hypothetical protein
VLCRSATRFTSSQRRSGIEQRLSMIAADFGTKPVFVIATVTGSAAAGEAPPSARAASRSISLRIVLPLPCSPKGSHAAGKFRFAGHF